MKRPFNRELLVEQMTALGLSERNIIENTTMSGVAFREARLAGVLVGHTTLDQLGRLAEVLGVDIADLLTSDANPPEPSPADPGDDARTLIALLCEATHPLDTGHLSRALGWERPRTAQAIQTAPAALADTGLRLLVRGTAISLQPVKRLPPEVRQAATKAQATRRGINGAQARVLRKLVAGEHIGDRLQSKTDRLTTGALKNLGCIELDERGRYRITDDLKLALDLT